MSAPHWRFVSRHKFTGFNHCKLQEPYKAPLRDNVLRYLGLLTDSAEIDPTVCGLGALVISTAGVAVF